MRARNRSLHSARKKSKSRRTSGATTPRRREQHRERAADVEDRHGDDDSDDYGSAFISSPCSWLTIEEASEICKFSSITIRRALKSAALRGYRILGGKHWRIQRRDLDKWVRGVVVQTGQPA